MHFSKLAQRRRAVPLADRLWDGHDGSACGGAVSAELPCGQAWKGPCAEEAQACELSAARICSLRMSPCPACRASSSIMCT